MLENIFEEIEKEYLDGEFLSGGVVEFDFGNQYF